MIGFFYLYDGRYDCKMVLKKFFVIGLFISLTIGYQSNSHAMVAASNLEHKDHNHELAIGCLHNANIEDTMEGLADKFLDRLERKLPSNRHPLVIFEAPTDKNNLAPTFAAIKRKMETAGGWNSGLMYEAYDPRDNEESAYVNTVIETVDDILSPFVKQVQTCAGCNTKNNLKLCGKCKQLSFCSIACQKKVWPQHRPNVFLFSNGVKNWNWESRIIII
jgi:MYND finger